VAFHEWWGVEPWAPTAYLWGADRDLAAPWKARLEMRLLGRLQLDAFEVDDARLSDFARRLRRHRPAILQGYATALDLFARHLERSGGAGFRPRVVRSAAETLAPEVRARLERVFEAPVRDVYGSRETAGLAAECGRGALHILGHGKVLEVVDEEGRPSPPGVPGRVLVTDLTNRAFGFVRYENGDVASFAPQPCACGIPYPRLERVHGRTSDFLTTPDGRRVHGEFFTHLFYGRDGVERFQVRQERVDAVEVLVVGDAPDPALAEVLAAMRERLGPGVEVTLRRVGRIETPPSGKHRFTVSRVPFLPGAAP
jgi:phenylacetate-CoA ligase